MGLFSFLRKNKQSSASTEGEYFSRSEEESNAVRGRGKRKQGGEAVDPVLPEKKRARRRLVGSIALVLAVIIGLPMILDSEPKPLADDIAIQIPSREKINQVAAYRPPRVTASAALDKKEETPTAPVASASATASLPTPPAAGTSAASASMNNKTGDSAKSSDVVKPASPDKTTANPPVAVKTDSRTEPKPAPKPATSAEPPATTQAADKADDAARAIAILEAKPDAKGSSAKPVSAQKAGKFVIQVAALAKQERVKELRAQLKDAGIETYTQIVVTKSGESTRVRVGPFASKEEAEKLRAKLIKMGLKGTLIPAAP